MTYSEFVLVNRPTIQIDLDQIRTVCNKLQIGLGFPEEGKIKISKSGAYLITRFEITWTEKIEGGKLIYSARIYGSEYCGNTLLLVDPILEMLGITRVEIDLPEPIIELPIPDWVGVVADSVAWTTTRKMFVSEAKAAYQVFVQQVQKVIGE